MSLINDIFFSFLFLAVPVAALKILQTSGISLRHISITYVFLLFYLVSAYSGIIGMYFGWNQYWINLGVTDRNVVLIVFFFSSVSLFLISLGFLFSSRVLGFQPSQPNDIQHSLNSTGFIFILLLILLCVLVTLIYIRRIPGLPIVAALKGHPEEAVILRSEATNAFSGKYHRYAMFMHNVLPFLTMILYSHALGKRRIQTWLVFVPVIFVTSFILLITTEKGPLLFFLAGLIFTYLLSKGKPINLRLAFLVTIFGIVLLFPMYIVFMGMYERSFSEILAGITSRIFGDIVPAYFYLKMFPESVSFLHGHTLPNPAGIIPGYMPYRITVEVSYYMRPEFMDLRIVGSAPTAFWAELYANFGFIGPFVFTPILGVLLYMMDVLTSRLPQSPIRAALIAWLAVHLMILACSMLSNFLVDLNMFLILLISLVLLFIQGQGRIPLQRINSHP
jgi:oligosaccharide repeat unit polymerase